MSRARIALVFGGRSPEHEVSLDSARAIAANVDGSRFDLAFVGTARDGTLRLGDVSLLDGGLEKGEGTPVLWPARHGARRLVSRRNGGETGEPIDAVFPIVHGWGGEDGSLQGVLELAGIPYVGSGVLGSSLAMDKDRARRILAERGIPVVTDVVLTHEETRDASLARRALERLGLPLFVKPARAGSSVGITKLKDFAELGDAIRAALEHDTKVLVERAVPDARELEVAILGNAPHAETSVVGEVVPDREFYDYGAKYDDSDSRLDIPAPIPGETAEAIRRHALDAFAALDLAGLARVDFLLGSDGKLVLSEANTLPGFTSISMYPRLWEASGVLFGELIDRLIRHALARHEASGSR